MASLSEMLNRTSGTSSTNERSSGPLRSQRSVSPQSSPRQADDEDDRRPARPLSEEQLNANQQNTERKDFTIGKTFREAGNFFTGTALGITELAKAAGHTILNTPVMAVDATIGLAEYATGQNLPGGWDKNEDGSNVSLGDYYRPGITAAQGLAGEVPKMGRRAIAYGPELTERIIPGIGAIRRAGDLVGVDVPTVDSLLDGQYGIVPEAAGDWNRQINYEVREEFNDAWNNDRAFELVAGDIGLVAGGAGMAAGATRVASAISRGSQGARIAHAAGSARYGLGSRTFNWATRNKGTNRGQRANNFASRADRVADRLDNFSYKADGYDPAVAAWRVVRKYTKRVRNSEGRKTQVVDKNGKVKNRKNLNDVLAGAASRYRDKFMKHDLQNKLLNEKAKYEETATGPQKVFNDHVENKLGGPVRPEIARVVTNLTAGTLQEWIRAYDSARKNSNINADDFINSLLKRFNDGESNLSDSNPQISERARAGMEIDDKTKLTLDDIKMAADYMSGALPEQELLAISRTIEALAEQGDANAKKLVESGRLNKSALEEPVLSPYVGEEVTNSLSPEAEHALLYETDQIQNEVKRLEREINQSNDRAQQARLDIEFKNSQITRYTDMNASDRAKRTADEIEADKRKLEDLERKIVGRQTRLDALKEELLDIENADDPVTRAMNEALGVDPSATNTDFLIDRINPRQRGELLDQWKELGDIKFVGTVVSKILELRHRAAQDYLVSNLSNFWGDGSTTFRAGESIYFRVPWFDKSGGANLRSGFPWEADEKFMARVEDFDTPQGRELMMLVMENDGIAPQVIAEFLNQDDLSSKIMVEDVTPPSPDNIDSGSNWAPFDSSPELAKAVEHYHEAHIEWRESAPDSVHGFNQPELFWNRGVQSLSDAANRGTRKIGEDNGSFGDLYADKELIGLMAHSIDLPVETIEKILQQLADPRGDGPLAAEINQSVSEIRDRIISELGDRDPSTGLYYNGSYAEINGMLHEAVHAEFSSQGLAGVTDAVDNFMEANPEAVTAWIQADNAADAMLAITDADGRMFGMEKDAVLGEDQVAALIRRKAYLDEFADEISYNVQDAGTNVHMKLTDNMGGQTRKFSDIPEADRYDVPPTVDGVTENRAASWTDVDGNAVEVGETGALSDRGGAQVAFLSPEDAAAIQRQIDAGGDHIHPLSGSAVDDIDGPTPSRLQGRDVNGVEYEISTEIHHPATGLVPVEWLEDPIGFVDPDAVSHPAFVEIGKEIQRVNPQPLPDLTSKAISLYLPSDDLVATRWDRYNDEIHADITSMVNDLEKSISDAKDQLYETQKDLAVNTYKSESDNITRDMNERYERDHGGTTSAIQVLEGEISALKKQVLDYERTAAQAQPLLKALSDLVNAPEKTLNQPLAVSMSQHLAHQAEIVRELVNQQFNKDTAGKASGHENIPVPPNAGWVRAQRKVGGETTISIQPYSVIDKMLKHLDNVLVDAELNGTRTRPSEVIKNTLGQRVQRRQIDPNSASSIDDYLGEGSPIQGELFRIMEEKGYWNEISPQMRQDLINELVKQDLNTYINDAINAGKVDLNKGPLDPASASFTMMLDLQQRIIIQVERAMEQPVIDKLNGSPLLDDAFTSSRRPDMREATQNIGNDLLNDLNDVFVDSFKDTVKFLDGELYNDFDLQKLRMQYMPRNYRVIAKNSVELMKSQLAMMRDNNVLLQGANKNIYERRKELARTTDPETTARLTEEIRGFEMKKDRLIMENQQLSHQLAHTPGDLRSILKQNQDPNSLFNPDNKRVNLEGVPYVRTGQGAAPPSRHITGTSARGIKVGEVDAERSAGRGIVTPEFMNHQRMEMLQAHELMRSEMVRILVNDKKFDGHFSWDARKIPGVQLLFENGGKPTLTAIGNAAAESGWQLVAQPRGDLKGAATNSATDPWRTFSEDTVGDPLWQHQVDAHDLSTMKVIRREVAEVVATELDAAQTSRFWQGADALTSMWKFTVLPIRAMWLINNVFGNLAMAAISSGNVSNSLGEIAGAMKKVLDEERTHLQKELGQPVSYFDTIKQIQKNDGAISNMPRRLNQTNYSLSEYHGINNGNQNPEMGLQRGAALMSDPDYVRNRRESTVKAKAEIADLEAKLEDPNLNPSDRQSLEAQLAVAQDVIGIGAARSKVLEGTATAVRTGYRINATVDSMFRAAVYQLEFDRGMNKVGQDARANNGLGRTDDLDPTLKAQVDESVPEVQQKAIENTLKALGDFTRLTKMEKSFIKRLIPFYPWLRHQITMTLRLPISNPARAGLLVKIYDVMVDEEDQNPEWAAQFGNSLTTPWGRTNALQGANPFESPLKSPLSPFSNNIGGAINPVPKFAAELLFSADIGSGNTQTRPNDQGMLTSWLNVQPTSAFKRMYEGDFKGGLGEIGYKLSGMTGQSALLRDAVLSQVEGTGPNGRGKREFTSGSFDSGDVRRTTTNNTTSLNKIFSGLGLPQMPFDQSRYEEQVRRQAIQNQRRRDRQES